MKNNLGLGYKILKVKDYREWILYKMMPIWEESDLSEALEMIEENNSKNKDNYGYTKLENSQRNIRYTRLKKMAA